MFALLRAHFARLLPLCFVAGAFAQAPTITSVAPGTGPEKRIVTVTGTNFSGAGIPSRTTRVNGTPVGSFSVSATTLTFAIPVGATSGPITVETIHGIATSPAPFVVGPGPAPANDNFANATIIAGPSGSLTGNTANATSEPGEPAHPGSNGGGASVWFKWTAPASGLYLFNPYDGQQFGIVQAIYTGSDVSALTLVANGLPPPSVFARYGSAAVLDATAGITYMIALDGYAGVMANYRLAWSPLGPPTVTTFTASAFAGQQVTISGTNFTPGATVTIGGAVVNPARITWNSATSIAVTQLPYAATTGPITVATPAGSFTTAGSFNALPPPVPVITGFSPSSGGAGTSVNLTGSNLWFGIDAPQPIVRFNGVAASSVNASNASSISAIVPPAASSGFITVEFPHGTAVSPMPFVVTTAFPSISGFSPTSGPPGTTVIISGANFGAVDQVRFNGTLAPFIVDSPSQITTIVPAGATTGEIVVGTPTSATFSGTSFVVTNPAPVITDFSPTAIASGMTVVINGAEFTGATTVLFNGINAAFTVVSPTQINATAPATLTPGPISVTTPFGTAVSPASYTVSLAPVITGITPSFGPINRIVSVSGSNFISPVTVRVNGTPIGSFSRSNTTVTFAIPAGATTGPVTVQTPNGVATSPMNLVIGPGPVPPHDNFATPQIIAGMSGVVNGNTANATKEPGEPNHATNPGGASVWFAWTAPADGLFLFNPSNSSSSQFGIIQSIYTGNALASLVQVASGLPPVSVFARYGSAAVLNATAGTTYRIALDGYNGVMADYRLSWSPLNPPTISGFSPGGGTAGQVINVNVNGSNFTPGAPVVLGGATVDPARLNYQNPNLITITQIPLGAVTGPISVTTPAGSATSAGVFAVTPPPSPTITGFSPGAAPVGSAVTITGTNFTGATAVLFNGTSAIFAVNSPATIVASVPAGASTGPITIVTPAGAMTSAAPFLVLGPPVITDQPDSQTVFVGATVSFTIGVTTPAPEEYLWFKNGELITGNPSATTRTLTLDSVGFADAGAYTCIVATAGGSAASEAAVLTVNPVPVIITLLNLAHTYDGSPKSVTAISAPPTPVHVTYDGSTLPPSAAGNYHVVATTLDPRYAGAATGTLTIARASASVTLANLAQPYDGTPRPVSVTTNPAGLPLIVTYNGTPEVPTLPGAYAVVATITDPNHVGTANGTLLIGTTALVRTMSLSNGGIDGSVQITLARNVTLNGGWVSGDLLVPGTPDVVLNGHPTYGGTLDAAGAATPGNYSVVLNGSAVLRHVIRRVDATELPAVALPPAPTGTRNVMLTSATQSAGDFATVRNLSVNGNAGAVAVPPGTYGDFTANGNASLVLGVSGSSIPAVYNLQRLTVNGNARVQIVGPVLLTVAGNVVAQGSVGDAVHPGWLTLQVAEGDVTVNGNGAIHGRVIAPNGGVTISAGAITGSMVADELRISGNGVLQSP